MPGKLSIPALIVLGVLAVVVWGVRIFIMKDFRLKKYINTVFVCPNCGHRFKRKMRRLLTVILPIRHKVSTLALNDKAAFAKCPACKVKDHCAAAFEDYYK